MDFLFNENIYKENVAIKLKPHNTTVKVLSLINSFFLLTTKMLK